MDVRLRREDGSVLCERCRLADNPLSRAKGLLGRSRLEPGEGMLLATSSIHTWFMRFAIDAVFLDGDLVIVAMRRNITPWHAAAKLRAKAVLELPAGECSRRGLRVGERLWLEKAAEPGKVSTGEALRVAVVTSDRRYGRMAAFLLGRRGFTVETVADADAAVAAASEGLADVVIVDGSDSLASAARAKRAIAAVAPAVAVILVAEPNGREDDGRDGPQTLDVHAKWGAFPALIESIEGRAG
jgi:uncharacterized membrane protein (UPF0127 family)